MSPTQYMTKEEIRNIPLSDYPLLMLSDNMESLVSARIKDVTNGSYNHLMWLVRPGVLVTQDWMLKETSLEDYLKKHRLKLWTSRCWSPAVKLVIKNKLSEAIKQPWYKRIYDPLQILGLRFKLPWLQLPGGPEICSDQAKYLKYADTKYDLEHPSPEDVNRYLQEYPKKYQVYGRYAPD